MKKSVCWAPAPNLKVVTVERREADWAVCLNGLDHAICPDCGFRSHSRHSSYRRTLRDLPALGTPVEVQAFVARWRCRNERCKRRIFAERIPGLAAPFARRTARLAGVVRLFGHSVGGRPSERLMSRLGMGVGHATILREVKRSARADAAPTFVRIAGIDDWAWKKGMHYGTLIVDLERRQVVDVLPDRSAASTAKWLKGHPEVEVISRDRAGLYADGAREGAPQARQVADRFHLLQNFREAIERQLIHPGPPVRKKSDVASESQARQTVVNGSRKLSEGAKHRASAQRDARATRQVMFGQIKALYDAGKTVTAIARELGLGRRRVERWVRYVVLPERNAMAPKACTPAYFEAYLSRRFGEGVTLVRLLFGEIRSLGYTGSFSHLARFISPWKNAARPIAVAVEAPSVSSPQCPTDYALSEPAPTPTLDPTNGRPISPLTAAALCVKPRGLMTARQISIVDALKAASAEFTTMRKLAMRFSGLFRGSSLDKLDDWMCDALSSGIYAMRRFAKTLRQDISAVQNAVTNSWSNGQTEGQINRLKTLKRSMYGRASIELLRARMLPLRDRDLHRE